MRRFILGAALLPVLAALAAFCAREQPEPTPADRPVIAANSADPPQDRIAELSEENAALRERIAELERSVTANEQQTTSLILRRLVESIQPAAPREEGVDALATTLRESSTEELWQGVLDLIESDGKTLTYSNDGFWEVTLLLMEIAKRGSEGIRFFANAARLPLPERDENDGNGYRRARDAREYAVTSLAIIRHETALDSLLSLYENPPPDFEYDLEAFEGHVTQLPVETMARYVPRLEALVDADMRGDRVNGPTLTIASNLAFHFGSATALRALYEPQMLEAGVGTALQLAGENHTRSALEFVRWIAANHTNENERERAIGILDLW